jgi:transglutaminase superfamily protein
MGQDDAPAAADALRNLATDYARAHRWADLLLLEPGLRADREYWTSFWGPACAVARWHEGSADARELLEDCIDQGFHDLEPFGTMFGESFGTEPDWPGLLARIHANVPPAPLELVRWPCAPPVPPLGLSRLDAAGTAALAARLPEPRPSALDTAEMLLAWVTGRWRHSSAIHDQSGDANVVLDRVERGERFACVEYTTVLTQALNAVQIPARPLSLFRPDYHAGLGTGHAVTEAWIDDLGKWALLDGQNGAVWRDADGVPLSALELQGRYLAGAWPEFSGSGPNFHADDAGEWFKYFYAVAVTGVLAWSAGPYVPIMEVSRVIPSQRISGTTDGVAPDLAAIRTGVADREGPALVFTTDHPYATGFQLTGAERGAITVPAGEPLPLARKAGEYHLTVGVVTRYGTLTPQPLHYRVR